MAKAERSELLGKHAGVQAFREKLGIEVTDKAWALSRHKTKPLIQYDYWATIAQSGSPIARPW